MTTFTVTTKFDSVDPNDGKLSLREAVDLANASAEADTIVFGSAIEGRTLVLTGGQLFLNESTAIDGDRNDDGVAVTIDGNGADRVIRCVGDLALADLTITNGHVADGENGGGLLILGSIDVKMDNVSVTGCRAGDQFDDYNSLGGGIYIGSQTNVVMNNCSILNNYTYQGSGIAARDDVTLKMTNITVSGNRTYFGSALDVDLNTDLFIYSSSISDQFASGIGVRNSSAHILNSIITDNQSGGSGGGIRARNADIYIGNSTISGNGNGGNSGNGGGIYHASGSLAIYNSTVTNNICQSSYADVHGFGGGIVAFDGLTIANSIVAGNLAYDDTFQLRPSDFGQEILYSNGHNIFGSDVSGNVAGDRENVAASTIFATVDPATGGGLVNAAGIVPLRANVANPALGGADRFAIGSADQIGTPRPSPTGTNPDAGAAESPFAHSTVSSANNDTLTGTAAANTLNGLAGHDFLKGLGGADTLNGGDGGDFLEGGAGNDRLNGGAGIDTANYGDSDTKVVVDLRGDAASDTDTAKRGSETDTLTGIEGAIGRGGADVFYGDSQANWFQGGGGKDTFTGGAGRDTYDLNSTSASAVGTARDVITDFVHLTDKIDLIGIDADSTVAGNQAFRWVGSAALTGPGEVGFFTSGGNTIIRISNDADAAAEAEIQLTGIKTLSALDFYL